MDLSVSSATLLPAKVSSMTLLLRCRPSRIALPPLAPRLFHRRSMRLSEVFFASISPRAPAPVEEMPLLRRSSSVSDELRARACQATGCDPTRGPGRMPPTRQAARERADWTRSRSCWHRGFTWQRRCIPDSTMPMEFHSRPRLCRCTLFSTSSASATARTKRTARRQVRCRIGTSRVNGGGAGRRHLRHRRGDCIRACRATAQCSCCEAPR